MSRMVIESVVDGVQKSKIFSILADEAAKTSGKPNNHHINGVRYFYNSTELRFIGYVSCSGLNAIMRLYLSLLR